MEYIPVAKLIFREALTILVVATFLGAQTFSD